MTRFSGYAHDNGEVVQYRWESSLDGILYLGDHNWYETSTLTDGLHEISFSVRDNLGTWSEPAVLNLIVTTPIPNHRPTISVMNPSNHSILSGNITGRAYDSCGSVLHVEISIDGGEWTIIHRTPEWNYSIDRNVYGDGLHTLSVRAFDGELYSETLQVTFRIEGVSHGMGSGWDENEDGNGGQSNIMVAVILGSLLVALIGSLFLPWERILKG